MGEKVMGSLNIVVNITLQSKWLKTTVLKQYYTIA